MSMERFIERKLRKVFRDFQQEADSVGGLCACKDLTYEGGNRPDYKSALVQQYYMLRYFPAYLAEYYLMYKHMLQERFLGESLKVISIGSGCGIDCWGLYFAICDSGGDPKRVNYTGIDIVKWKYQEILHIDNSYFINKDITEWTKLDENDYNVIVFPKSIGEFSDKDFNIVCDIFVNTDFSEKRICGLCSLMDIGKEGDAEWQGQGPQDGPQGHLGAEGFSRLYPNHIGKVIHRHCNHCNHCSLPFIPISLRKYCSNSSSSTTT